MTTGSTTLDSRSYGGYYSGYLPVGRLMTKSWSGSDQTPRPPRGPTTRRVSHETLLDVWCHGKKIRIKHTVSKRLYVPDSRPPRRSIKFDDHPFSCSWDDLLHVSYITPYNRNTGGGPFYTDSSAGGQGISGGNGSIPFSANDQIALLGKMREAVAGSDFNLGVSLAEGREAVAMIGNSARRIASSIFAAKRGNWEHAARILVNGSDRANLFKRTNVRKKTFAQNWLQLQYGWLPLLKDAEAGAQFLAHHLNVPRMKRTVVSKTLTIKGSIYSAMPSTVSYVVNKKVTRRQIIARFTEVNVPQLSGILDPASVAWEVTPYSFVADWFIPIGSWLSARSLASSLSGSFVTSTKSFFLAQGLRSAAGGPPFFFVGGDYNRFRHTGGTFDRSISSSLEVPRPELKSLDKALSIRHCINAVALLGNVIK